MNRRVLSTLLAALFVGAMASPTPARAGVVIKIATLAPEGSTWYKAVRKIADEWSRISDGEVTVKIYAGGVVGDEGSAIRKMRIGQLHAAAVTNVGLSDVDPAAQVTATPRLIHSYEELDYVMGKMNASFEQRLLDKGFVLLTWGDVGWVHIFSKTPLGDPADAHKFKCYAGDGASASAVEAVGFQAVTLSSTDVLPSLQSGLIDAFPATPLAALSQQWFALAPNMLDVPWSPLVGATVITKDAWAMIPAKYHEPFKAAALSAGEDIKNEVRRLDTKAIEVMKKYGLKVNTVDAEMRGAWQAAGRKSWGAIRGKLVPEDVFDAAKQHVADFRAQNK
jgi:TRAP-type C4-dicarboxylate transport system substrate-binding protein